jgi:hypothetical protein
MTTISATGVPVGPGVERLLLGQAMGRDREAEKPDRRLPGGTGIRRAADGAGTVGFGPFDVDAGGTTTALRF